MLNCPNGVLEIISFAMKKAIVQGKNRCARMGLGLVLSLPLVSPAAADEELRQPATDATPEPLRRLKGCMAKFPGGFNIIEPLDAPTEGTEWNPWQAGATQSDDIRVWMEDGTLRIDGAGAMQDFTDCGWGKAASTVIEVPVEGKQGFFILKTSEAK